MKSDHAELATGADPDATPAPDERLLREEATPDPSQLRMALTASDSNPSLLARLFTSD